MSQLSKIRSSAAVQAAFDEFVLLGCTTFLERYGFGASRDFRVVTPRQEPIAIHTPLPGLAL